MLSNPSGFSPTSAVSVNVSTNLGAQNCQGTHAVKLIQVWT